jgi:hypothetical protein
LVTNYLVPFSVFYLIFSQKHYAKSIYHEANQTISWALSLFLSVNAVAQTARVQVIHNSPDAAASTVDI